MLTIIQSRNRALTAIVRPSGRKTLQARSSACEGKMLSLVLDVAAVWQNIRLFGYRKCVILNNNYEEGGEVGESRDGE